MHQALIQAVDLSALDYSQIGSVKGGALDHS